MHPSFVTRDRSFGYEFLHEAVIDRDLAQLAVAEHVTARITDVGNRQNLAVMRVGDNRDGGVRCAHAGLVGVHERGLVDLTVGLVDRSY